MTREARKKVNLQTAAFFLIICAVTGITYNIFNPESKESNIKLLFMHIIAFVSSYLFSYFGVRTAIKKGQIKE